MIEVAWAFFKRDAAIALSYKTTFIALLLGNVLILGLCFYLARMVGSQPLPVLDKYGGNLFAFMLIGVALMDCIGVSLTTFAQQIREGQMTGSLEATLMSPVHLPLVLLFSSLYSYFFAALRFLIYIFLGIAVYGVRMGNANLGPAVVIFILTIACCAGIGITWASIIMVIKRGESILSLGGYIILFLSGTVFPVESFDPWLRTLASFVPLSHGLEGMRLALLQGYGFAALAPVLLKLLGFTVVLLAIGVLSFEWAVREAKKNGSLTEF